VPDDLGEDLPLDPPVVGRLHEIRVPMLLIVGELDQPSAPEQSAFIAEHVPHAERVSLPTAHLPSMERPNPFNEIVLAFLRRLDSAAWRGPAR
jgi:3-oxoadipate enol-lactonase